MPQVDADDTTPPPAERPILRQSLAFQSDKPSQIVSTYEASVEPAPKTTHFLPGQVVPAPPRTRAPRKTKTGIKRPRRPDAYPGQTTRFRLQTYDPTPSSEPPIAHGNGPYSSLYRGVAPSQDRQDSPDASTTSGGPSSSTIALSNGPSSGTQDEVGPLGISPVSAPPESRASTSRDHSNATPEVHAQTVGLPPHSYSQPPSPLPPPPSSGHSVHVTDTSLNMPDRPSPGPHYRRHYDDKGFSPTRERRRSSINSGAKPSSSSGQDKDSPCRCFSNSKRSLIDEPYL